jgi:hypothetical protein
VPTNHESRWRTSIRKKNIPTDQTIVPGARDRSCPEPLILPPPFLSASPFGVVGHQGEVMAILVIIGRIEMAVCRHPNFK